MKPVLSPKELAAAIGVSESSMKRWTDDGVIRAARTAGGHRRIPIDEAIRFIRESRAPLVRPEILGLPDIEAVRREPPSGRSDSERFYTFLSNGQAPEARGLLLSLYLAGETTEAIMDGPVHDAMTRMGELWKHDPAGIFFEHRATDICMQAIQQLRMVFKPPRNAPVALGGAPSGDPYLIPSLCASTVLASMGFHVFNLGPDTPTETVLLACEQLRPSLVWISISAAQHPDGLRAEIPKMADALAVRGARLIIGGQKHGALELPTHANIRTGASMTQLVAFAREIIESQEAAGSVGATS